MSTMLSTESLSASQARQQHSTLQKMQQSSSKAQGSKAQWAIDKTMAANVGGNQNNGEQVESKPW